MSLVTPMALAKNAFDATEAQIFYFTSVGGDQVVKNRLTIVNNNTSQVVYQSTVTSYSFNHLVPAHTLINGQYYYYYFNTYNVDNVMSANSNSVQFYCYNSPVLTFTNMPSDNVIQAASYNFAVSYTQIEGEYVNYVNFYLYNASGTQIGASSEMYGELAVPQAFDYTFNGFENGNSYSIEVKGVTVNGTQVTTGKIDFIAKYYNPSLFTLLNLENKCDLGCVRLTSNVIVANGNTYGEPIYWYGVSTADNYIKWDEPYTPINGVISQWSSPYALELMEPLDYVKWDGGYSIPSNFTWSTWLFPHQLGLFATIGTETNGYTLTLTRMIPYGETEPKDFVELKGYIDGVLTVYQRSNYVGLMNNSSYYMIWVRKIGNTYTLILTEYAGTVTNVGNLQWNTYNSYPSTNVYPSNETYPSKPIESQSSTADSSSNVAWNFLTDYVWNNESYHQETISPIYLNGVMDSLFPFIDVRLTNGVYDNMAFTGDTISDFSLIFPTWDYNTKFICDFNGNINGGNFDVLLSQLQYIRVKRKKSTDTNWLDLKQYPVTSIGNLTFTFDDYYVPSLNDVDYAVVPVLNGDVEGSYIMNSTSTKFNCITIADKNKVFKLCEGIIYGGDTQNIPIGMYIPLNGTYPIPVRNNQTNYATGSLAATLYGYNFEENRTIDRIDIVNQRNDLIKYLTDFNAKIIKDWNGNIWLVRFNGSPTVSYNSNNGNSPIVISAAWVEQGKYDSQSDMCENGLVEVNE